MSAGPEMRTPAGLRWSCGGCGDCCRKARLGPVEPEVIARLESERIGERWAPAAGGFADRTERGWFLRKVDGRCVFLAPDQRCAVHTLLGGHAKPGFCREFPYLLTEDARGVAAVIRPGCGGFHHSFATGDAVGPELAAIAALPRPGGVRRFDPPAVPVLGARVPTADWLAWEAALLADREVVGPVAPRAAVAAARATLAARVGAALPPPQAAQYDLALGACVHALDLVLAQARQQPGGDPAERAFVAQMHDVVRAAALGEAPRFSADAERYLDLLFRSHLLAKRWATWGGVPEGLGVWLLGVEIAARAAGTGELAGFAEVYASWEWFESNGVVTAILQRAAPATADLFVHA